jgi:reactive intermediate/imine deaminase
LSRLEDVRVKRAVSTPHSPAPAGCYSQGIAVGPFVFVAGQGPVDPATSTSPAGIEAQTHQVLRNIQAILAAEGCTLANVVKVTAHLADIEDFGAFNEVYAEYFDEPYPVRTTVGSQLIGILVEIDVIAYRPEARLTW